MSNRIESSELCVDSPQTGLHLFDRPLVNRGVRQKHFDSFVDYVSKYRNVDRSLNDLRQTTVDRLERLSRASYETGDQMAASYGSAVSGIVYLKLLDEFEADGIVEQHAYDFFQKCLEVNDEKCAAVAKLDNVGKAKTRSVERFIQDRVYSELPKTAVFVSMDPPAWYTGSNSSWRKLLHEYKDFTTLLGNNGYGYED